MRNPNYRRATRYEVTARKDGREFSVGATAQVSRAGLLELMQSRGAWLIELCEIGDADLMTFATRPRVHAVCAGWEIGFTGRTLWESIQRPIPPVAVVSPAIAAAFGMADLPNVLVRSAE